MNALPVTSAPTLDFLTTREVEVFSKQSYATLKRRHREGHDTGLRKRGRRVLFHVPTLVEFLLGQTAKPPDGLDTR